MQPLEDKYLRQEAQDPRLSTVVLHFRTQGSRVHGGIFFSAAHPRQWVYAVANETTGWNFRTLAPNTMVFHTSSDDPLAQDVTGRDTDTGWVTFLAPAGLTYIAVTSVAVQVGLEPNLVATALPDRISVGHSLDRSKSAILDSGWDMLDFIDAPRFGIEVPRARSLIYAGTIVRTLKCTKEDRGITSCPYDLAVEDDSALALAFVNKYGRDFPALSFHTQLLTIPQSRTIEIRGGPAGN